MALKQKEYFKNAKTWKQISTNVPPEMLKALKARVTTDYTMSHLLRDMIAESEVMRGYPQPRWSVELARELASLRAEIAELRAVQEERREEPKLEPVCEEQEERPLIPVPFEVIEGEAPQTVPSEQPKKTKPFAFLEKVPAMLGFARKSA